MKDIHTIVILAYNESDDLEECIKSVLNQSVKSNVVIATSTKNDYILEMASTYGLGLMINNDESNKGRDYNFALNAFNTELVTIAHQDDLYDRNYTKEILKIYKKNKDATMIFTDYYEIHDDKKIKYSKSLFKKRWLIRPLKYYCLQTNKYFKKRTIKYFNAICTSSVTFVKSNIPEKMFDDDMIYNNDWEGFYNLSRNNSRIIYIPKKLVGYRLVEKLNNDVKINEDIIMYNKMWPKWLIKCIYRKKGSKDEKVKRVF